MIFVKQLKIPTICREVRVLSIPCSSISAKTRQYIFENLQSLYHLFDLDKDGILNFKEYEKLLRCLGYRLSGKNSFTLVVALS